LNMTFAERTNVEIISLNGQTIESGNFTGRFVKQLNNGLYIVKINGNSQKVIVK